MVKHTIWSNRNLDVNDWRDAYKEHLEINGKDIGDSFDDSAVEDYMYRTNDIYLEDERTNLNMRLSMPILLIADIGRWDGRHPGYQVIKSGNIADCLYTDCDYATWFVDELGDFRCDAVHHDGVNCYLYRVFKDGVSDTQIENLKEKIYNGTATRKDITRVTRRLGDEIGAVYGWTTQANKEIKNV